MKQSEKDRIKRAMQETMDYDELMNCTRCGFCLPSCPTYIDTDKDEVHSPRGRIALMKGVVDGLIEPDEHVKQSIDMCLGCRACEIACPSGVNFGRLLEQARDAIYQQKKLTWREKVARNTAFKHLFPKQNRMIHVHRLLRFYQKSNLNRIARSIGIMKLFPEQLRMMEKILPDVPKQPALKKRQTFYMSKTPRKKRVAFFTGCLMDTMFKQTNDATVKLLQAAGCEIVVPRIQSCCGALAGHSGERDQAREMAKKNIEAFEQADVDYIITNAGGCGAFLVEYAHLLQDEREWKERAEQFSHKIKDFTQVLYELNFHKRPLKLQEKVIVTYQDSCHLKNGQKTFVEPRELIESIEGVQYVEMKDAGRCCGSAGIYNLLEPEMSMRILDYKMETLTETKATTVVTTNPGCLLQMKVGIEREGISDRVQAVHLADLLLAALKTEPEA